MINLAYILPPKIQAGVTFERCAQLPQYPAPDWVLSLIMRGPSVINLAAAADGTGHKFAASATQTTEWNAGIYSYAIRVTKGEEVVQLEASTVEVLPDLAASTEPGDLRSHARKTLEAIEAVLEKRATRDQERYVIEGQNGRRELWRTPVADLLKLRDVYRAEVRREDAAARGKSMWGPAVRVRF